MTSGRDTPYGFEWGAARVTRVLDHKGGVLINVGSNRGNVDLWVTPTGFIRVHDRQRKPKRRKRKS